MSGNRIKDFADRLDRIEDERLAALADARDVYKEAKGEGYNVKALRRVLAERRRQPDAAYEADLEMYRSLLGVPGATYRSVADQVGVSKSKLQRLVPRKENGTAGHDPETGEITENGATSDTVPGDDARTPEPSRSAEVVSNSSSGPSVQGCDGAAQAAAGPLDPNSDGLDIPPALRRVKAA